MRQHRSADKTDARSAWGSLLIFYVSKIENVLGQHYKVAENKFPEQMRDGLSAIERNQVDAFQRFNEVVTAIDSLALILALAGRRPSARRIQPVEALRFYNEAYLQQIFIVRERLVRWLRFHKKQTVKDSDFWLKLKTAEAKVSAAFEGPDAIRNSHVHEARHDTDPLIWASSLELMVKTTRRDAGPEAAQWQIAATLSYEECRANFKSVKQEELKTLEKLLDMLASQVAPIAASQLQ